MRGFAEGILWGQGVFVEQICCGASLLFEIGIGFLIKAIF